MHKNTIINIFKQHKPKSWKKVRDYIIKMNIFDINVYQSSPLPASHPILMLFHQLIPKCITNVFKTFKLGLSKYRIPLLESLHTFYQHLNTNIWIPRTIEFKNWKHIVHNIWRKDFKNYYKNQRNNNSSDHTTSHSAPPVMRTQPVINIYNHLNLS